MTDRKKFLAKMAGAAGAVVAAGVLEAKAEEVEAAEEPQPKRHDGDPCGYPFCLICHPEREELAKAHDEELDDLYQQEVKPLVQMWKTEALRLREEVVTLEGANEALRMRQQELEARVRELELGQGVLFGSTTRTDSSTTPYNTTYNISATTW